MNTQGKVAMNHQLFDEESIFKIASQIESTEVRADYLEQILAARAELLAEHRRTEPEIKDDVVKPELQRLRELDGSD